MRPARIPFSLTRIPLILALVGLLSLSGCPRTPHSEADVPWAADFSRWAIACDHVLASQAGNLMLAKGGNAVDAAVAASFCLSVVRPFSCGIGGGGFMVISLPPSPDHPQGRAVALDYREACPAAVGPHYYDGLPGDASRRGPHAVGVPGTVAGLLYALDRYGTLDRATVLAPAIRVAREGFPADEAHVGAVAAMAEVRRKHPELRAGLAESWVNLAHEGHLAAGEKIVNELQARTLESIAREGADAFYKGDIAEAMVEAVGRGGGPLRRSDLQAYSVRERPALSSRCGPWRILSMPPPSSGGVVTQQVFGLLDRLGGLNSGQDMDSPAWRHMLIEAFKHAFADRARWLADDAFAPVPVKALTSPAYLDSLAARFDPDHTLPSSAYGTAVQIRDDSGTSHISVLDRNGMAVGCTETINLEWGSCVEVSGYGFLLNNEMDDFTTSEGANAFGLVQSDWNRPAPGKRPLSSMSPTIVQADGRVIAVAGASGGPRIISGTLQVLLAALVFGNDAGEAVARPRLHHQWQPDEVRVETGWKNRETLAGLRARGHEIVSYPGSVGVVQAVVVKDGRITAASDPRKGGRPAGR